MRASQAAVDLIKKSEGLRLLPYDDGAGNLTIGFGHKMTEAEKLTLLSVSVVDALSLLAADLSSTERLVWGLVADIPGVTQGQFDGLTVFTFNCGVGTLAKSSILAKLRAGDAAGAADSFLQYDHEKGIVVSGLVTRRKAERDLFLS